MVRQLAYRLAGAGIRVNAIAPGFVDTDMPHTHFPPDLIQRTVQTIPLRQMAQPEEVAEAILYLGSDAAGYITGEVLDINGGSLIDSHRRFPMRIPTAGLDYRDTYRLLSGSIVPRPIAWVTTRDPATGVVNLAPFSFFTGCSVIPPMICFAAERRWGQKKDTIRNIEATGEFVLNVATVSLAQAVVVSAKDYPPEVSEVEDTGLHLLPSDLVQVPRIAEAPIHMECKLHQIMELGTSPHSLVIGHVVQFHVRDDVYEEGRINFEKLDALGRLAGDWYCTTRERINVTRLDFRKDSY